MKINKDVRIFLKSSWIYFAIALVVALAGLLIVDICTPVKPNVFNTKWTWNGVLMFMFACAGIGWVFHGTGFLLVRVK